MYPNRLTSSQASILANIVSRGHDGTSENLDLSELNAKFLDNKRNMRLLFASELHQFGFDKLRLFAHQEAIYQFPTIELISALKSEIGKMSCIEIGAGRGDIGRHLGITMTDSHQQKEPHFKKLYSELKQPTIKYPKDVEKLNYKDAIKKYRPEIVLACWVTHQYNLKRHESGGNETGIDSDWIMKRVKKLIFVGNTEVHKFWQIPGYSSYVIQFIPGIVSRAAMGDNFMVVYEKLLK
jgi:hypothetical protein